MRNLMSAAAIVAGLAMSGEAVAVEWNMTTPYADSVFHTINILAFADDVAAATDGEVTITVHSAGSLFGHPEIKDAVVTGQVEMGEVLISLLSNENPIYGVDSIPFLATSYVDAHALWEASRPIIEEMLAAEGLRLLFALPWPPQGLYSIEVVESAADLEGVKFRAYNAATSRVAELMVAVPTQVEVPDIPQAFATGIVEAMITSPSTGVSTSAWDFVEHFYEIDAWIPKNMVIVNQRAFDDLSPEFQQAMLDAAALAEERGWEMSQEETAEKIQILIDNGIQVHDPSPQLASDLAVIGETMTAEWLAEAGDEGASVISGYENLR